MKKYIVGLVLVLSLGVAGYVTVNWYPYLFAKTISGKVQGVEKVDASMAIVNGNGSPPGEIFSYAVAIKETASGEIFTASSEDRRWAVVQKDQCVEAKFLPYPPWNLARSGAWFGARLIKQYDCR